MTYTKKTYPVALSVFHEWSVEKLKIQIELFLLSFELIPFFLIPIINMQEYSPTPFEIEEEDDPITKASMVLKLNKSILDAFNKQGQIRVHGYFISFRELVFNSTSTGKWEFRILCEHLSIDQILNFYGLSRREYLKSTTKYPFSQFQGKVYFAFRVPKEIVPTLQGFHFRKENKTMVQVVANPLCWNFNGSQGITFFLTELHDPLSPENDFSL